MTVVGRIAALCLAYLATLVLLVLALHNLVRNDNRRKDDDIEP